ncbi:hypothetical protein MNBD_NITROSPINAE01-940 [hydrothermal vent metagenome]|uniref:Transmembrane protein n=1 Tax=hydrothermal vent metagenome TaxID=652676 RepID=A0A3B1D121_9ZZZZ
MNATFDFQRYLKEGWYLFRDNASNILVAAIIFVAIHFVANFIPFVSLLISGPLMGGMYYVILDAEQGKEFNAMRIFDGFRLKFAPLVLVAILSTVFMIGGLILLILPGFLIMGWYLFPYLYVLDKDMDFWPAMEASRKIGFKNHANVFLLAVLFGILNLIGFLLFGVGLLVSVPYTLCVTIKAYEHLKDVGLNDDASHQPRHRTPPPPPIPPTI